jgi:hypothetical protein
MTVHPTFIVEDGDYTLFGLHRQLNKDLLKVISQINEQIDKRRNKMKLFRIEVKLLGNYFVAAKHPTEAQEKLCKYLGESESQIKSISFFEESNESAPVFNNQYRYIP